MKQQKQQLLVKLQNLLLTLVCLVVLHLKLGGLTKATLEAKQAGTYLSTGEKARRFGQGMLGAGVAEGVFVGDVEDAGTFGDFLGGPTEIKRGDRRIHKQNY